MQLFNDHLCRHTIGNFNGFRIYGALSYIGNAPNFMVKSIATQHKINMPSFFGYMKWSIGILIPIFIIDNLVFFVL